MAELGTIQTINPNAGTIPIDTRGLERGVQQALGLVEKVHTDRVLKDATVKVEQDIEAALLDADAVRVEVPIDPTLSPAVDKMRREIVDLQQDVINGNRAQAGRARFAINQTLTELRKVDPDLAAQITQAVQGIVATSPGLAALGLQEAADKTRATQARQQLLDIKTKATKRWSQGGLGMAFNSDFTDPKVLTDYLEKISHRVKVEAAQMRTAVRIAGGSATVEDLLADTNALLIGDESGFADLLTERQELTREYYDELKKPANEQSATIIDGFKAQLESLVFENEVDKREMQLAFDGVWDTVIKRSQPEFAAAKAMFDDRIKMLDAQTAGMIEIKPARYYEIQESAIKSEGWGLRYTLPGYDKFLRWNALDPEGNIWSMIKESPTGANVPVLLRSSQAGVDLATKFWDYETPEAEVSGLFLNSLGGEITPDLTPDQITTLMLNQQRQGPFPVDAKTSSETEEIQVGMARNNNYRRRFQQMVETPKWSTPQTAATIMLASTNMFVMYNTIGNPSDDQMEASIKMLADPSVLNGIRVVGDQDFKNVRFAFAKEAKNFLGDNNRAYAQARTREQKRWGSPVLGRQLQDFINVQFFQNDSDDLSIDIDENLVAEAAYIDSTTVLPLKIKGPTLQEWKKRNQPLVDQHVRNIRIAAEQVIAFANADIRATAHVQFANSSAVSEENLPSYRAMADRIGWLDILGGQ